MLPKSLLTFTCLSFVIPKCLFTILLVRASPTSDSLSLTFSAQHELRLHNDGQVIQRPLSDPISSFEASNTTITLKARPTTISRWKNLKQPSAHNEYVKWDAIDVLGPDIEDIHTLVQLARMTGNAYALPGQKNWYEVDPTWNNSFPFGWEDSSVGFRGHVFLSPDHSTAILSIKGTTLQGPTSKTDKYNDNLLFSCCCARVDVSWVFRTVCDCYARRWRCDNTCLRNALVEDSLFYSVGVNLVNDLMYLYPYSNIWLIGHSLGGALASLLGTTFGLPAVAFESPGERLAASRLHLPLPPSTSLSPVTHIYHTADPIPQGACTGISSLCTQGGYALETRCHLGKIIVFDTVGRLGWRVDVRKHVIRDVIEKVLEYNGNSKGEKEWEWEEGRKVPMAREETDCVDCYKWEFGEFKDRKSVLP